MSTDKPHLSATQLEMFWRCPEQYRRRYIEGEVILPGIAIVVGKAVHAGAEVNFRQKIESHSDLPSSEIVEAAAARFDAEKSGGLALTGDEITRGFDVVLGEAKDKAVQLAAVHAEQQAPDYQPTAVEHKTRIVFPDATHDLLAVTDLRDDQRRVVDLKTAARKMPRASADTSTQLTIYAAAHQLDTGEPASEVRLDVLTKTRTPTRQVITSTRDEADFRALVHRVNVTLAAIHAGSFPPASPGAWICSPKWCGYWFSCPFVNSERIAAAESNEG